MLNTDGITEAMNLEDEMFGDDRLLEAVNMSQSNDVEQMTLGIIDRVNEFSGNAPQFDDITCLTIRYNSGG